jgi:hypothetical protein
LNTEQGNEIVAEGAGAEITEFDRLMAAGALEEQAARLADRAGQRSTRTFERDRLLKIAAERRVIAARFRRGIDPANLRL